LIQLRSLCGRARFSFRASADLEIIDNQLNLELMLNKANLFHKATGLRLGGWA